MSTANDTQWADLVRSKLAGNVDPEVLEIFREAIELGIGSVSFDFSGSGDSGDLNYVQLKDPDGAYFDATVGKRVQVSPTSYTYQSEPNPVWTPKHETFKGKMSGFFDKFVNDRIGWDWYNNDGGGGIAVVNFATGNVEISGYYMSQVPADGCEFNMLGEENE